MSGKINKQLNNLLCIFAAMAKANKAGAPKKKEHLKKVSMTCSVSKSTSDKAIKLYGSRGKAIEAAVAYHAIISRFKTVEDEI